MNKPIIKKVYTDNGDLSHYTLIDVESGEKLWSEFPEECKSMGFPVKQQPLTNDKEFSLENMYTAATYVFNSIILNMGHLSWGSKPTPKIMIDTHLRTLVKDTTQQEN